MKRRSFLKGLAAALVVPKILLSEKAKTGIPVPEDNTSTHLVTWGEGSIEQMTRRTVRTGLPDATWKKLYEGVKPIGRT